jgi:hypothetical protein
VRTQNAIIGNPTIITNEAKRAKQIPVTGRDV